MLGRGAELLGSARGSGRLAARSWLCAYRRILRSPLLPGTVAVPTAQRSPLACRLMPKLWVFLHKTRRWVQAPVLAG